MKPQRWKDITVTLFNPLVLQMREHGALEVKWLAQGHKVSHYLCRRHPNQPHGFVTHVRGWHSLEVTPFIITRASPPATFGGFFPLSCWRRASWTSASHSGSPVALTWPGFIEEREGHEVSTWALGLPCFLTGPLPHVFHLFHLSEPSFKLLLEQPEAATYRYAARAEPGSYLAYCNYLTILLCFYLSSQKALSEQRPGHSGLG